MLQRSSATLFTNKSYFESFKFETCSGLLGHVIVLFNDVMRKKGMRGIPILAFGEFKLSFRISKKFTSE